MSHLDPSDLLREHGLRVTRQRSAVIEVLRSEPHSRAEAVIDLVRDRADVATGGRAVSVQAVYDVLNTLTARGVVRRIQPAGAVARYELATGDNHHHAVCRSCGAMHDVECATGSAPCLDADPAPHTSGFEGFVIDEAEVIYWGLCPDCQREHSHQTAGTAGTSSTDPTEEGARP
ncbi:ferric uptake regulation protein FurA [Marmoricola endophyticus]|uniref:Ferric uptake regulation protein FurA n=1 Tax=Marmoricola endophyticus TaxID=2040280 RepID=A0A917F1P1_9ACTN|nr:Fur family transcriptional regulator [Marmoricola endophyticus]GGF34039.1 ferric uptake regulation protein FurA [Marmoricola endophyticus]